ncbi:HAD family hydrolase [Microbacterium sp.]|uniref:HAD family hydrolase n=1 Tax=Microbacterium sp. TaxID=51671 RepID=UPI0039E516A4
MSLGASSPVRAVCWDWNGTLLDDVEICRAVMSRVLVSYGLPPLADLASYRRAFRFPIPDFYADVGLDAAVYRDAADQYLRWLAECIGDAELHVDALHTLDGLAGRGVRQVLASATLPEALARQMLPHAIEDRFEAVLTIADAFRASKHGAIEDWLAVSGLEPHDVLMVGDTNHDHEIADALGCRFVHFDGGHQRAPRGVRRIGALKELHALL